MYKLGHASPLLGPSTRPLELDPHPLQLQGVREPNPLGWEHSASTRHELSSFHVINSIEAFGNTGGYG